MTPESLSQTILFFRAQFSGPRLPQDDFLRNAFLGSLGIFKAPPAEILTQNFYFAERGPLPVPFLPSSTVHSTKGLHDGVRGCH